MSNALWRIPSREKCRAAYRDVFLVPNLLAFITVILVAIPASVIGVVISPFLMLYTLYRYAQFNRKG